MSKDKPAKEVKLFPFPMVNHNVESLNARHHGNSGVIYRVVLFALIAAFISLPFIEVDVTTRSRGMIRPLTETNQVVTATGGMIVATNIRDNATFCVGDTLMVLGSPEMDVRQQTIADQQNDNREMIRDLRAMLNATKDAAATYPTLRTELYQKEYARYRQEMDRNQLQLAHAARQLKRHTQLLAAGSVSKMEQEQSEFEHQLAENALKNTRHQRRQLWSQEMNRYQREINELSGEVRQLGERARQYVITAPIDGTINQDGGLQVGNFVSAGQTIATLAPDDALQVEVFVAPTDIGLIQRGMQAQLQVDAYHHNRWGMATGEVTEIATDVIEVGQQPVFVVKCTLDQQNLSLSNGYVGNFKPGMSLTAHFTLTERTIYDLLHDKLDDWLDPTAAPIAQAQLK